MADRTISYDLIARDRASQAFDSAGKGSDRFGTKLAGMGKVAGVALAAATAAAAVLAVKLGKDAVNAASDLNETVSKSRAIFGPASADLEKWANTAASSLGQSKQQALDAAGTFGNLFVQLGVGREVAVDMSKQMVTLASDFASFHNADITEVIDAQSAAFRGEYDALQRFVPTINAAAVEQEALRATGKKTTKELTLQEKALATQTLMMKGAGDATGDFARTSDGLANRQRILSAQFEDVKAKIGNALLPVMVNLAGFVLNKIVPALSKLGEAVAPIVLGLSAFVAAFREGDVTSDGFVGTMERLGNYAREVLLPVIRQIADFLREHWQVALAVAAAAVLLLISPIALVVAAVVAAYVKFEWFRDAIAAVVQFITETWERHRDRIMEILTQVGEMFSSAFYAVKAIVDTVVAIITELWDGFGRDLVDNLQRHLGGVLRIVQGAFEILTGIFDLIKAILTGKWGEAWDAIKQILGGVWEAMLGIVTVAVETVRVAVETGLGLIKEVWEAVWNGFKTFMSDIWEGIKTIVGNAIKWVLDKIKTALGPIDEIIDKVGGIVGGGGEQSPLHGSRGRNFDSGGVVPGPLGSPQMILAHGGETVLPTHKTGGMASQMDPVEWGRIAARAYASELIHTMRTA